MTVTFNAANQAVVVSALDLVTSALTDINVVAAGEQPSPEDAALGLEKLQRLIDQWNARRDLIFAVSFPVFTLQANHAPHTIGPGGDFNVPVRPVQVISAAFILNSATANPVDTPIRIRDAEWWAANPLKSLVSSIVTELYYEPASPLGQLNFFPISNVANPVRLQIWSSLSQAINLQGKLGFVQGYWEAVVADLAVRCCPPFERPVTPDLRAAQNQAMRIIEANNNKPPRIDTDVGGLPSARHGGRPDYNFLTGLRE